MLTRRGLVWPIHFLLCDAVTREDHRVSANAFSLTGKIFVTQAGQPMDLHRFWDSVITSSSNLTRLRNEATALRNRQEFQRSQLTELANTDFESWAKESFEIATKIACRNGGRIGIPKCGDKDCRDVRAAPVLPAGYVVSASRMADRRMILAGYRLADLLTRVSQTFD
jgi:hypothetical protein